MKLLSLSGLEPSKHYWLKMYPEDPPYWEMVTTGPFAHLSPTADLRWGNGEPVWEYELDKYGAEDWVFCGPIPEPKDFGYD